MIAVYLTPSAAQEKGYERIDKHPKSTGMADKTRFPNNGTVRNSSASGEQTGQMP